KQQEVRHQIRLIVTHFLGSFDVVAGVTFAMWLTGHLFAMKKMNSGYFALKRRKEIMRSM
ncbi:hypothetical protein ACNJ5X_005114, partial [Escherichia coli]